MSKVALFLLLDAKIHRLDKTKQEKKDFLLPHLEKEILIILVWSNHWESYGLSINPAIRGQTPNLNSNLSWDISKALFTAIEDRTCLGKLV